MSATPPIPPESSPGYGAPPPPLPGQPRHAAGPSAPGKTQNPQPYQVATVPGTNPGDLHYGGVPGVPMPDYSAYASRRPRAMGLVGLVIAVIGAALVVVSFTTLDWLSGGSGVGGTARVSFKDLHTLVGRDAPTIPRLYFDWLGWALLAAVVIFAVLGNLPTRTHALWRVLGILAGFAGVVVTFYALYDQDTTLEELKRYGGPGFWLALAGFLLAGIGAVIGPRRGRI